MSLRNLVRETLLSLTANKGRSALTILGIVVGIAAVIIMIALGHGTTAYVQNEIAAIGSNLIMVSPGGQSAEGGRGGGGSALSGGSAVVKTLTVDDADAIASSVSGVQSVAPQVQGSYEVVADAANKMFTTIGTTASYAAIRNVETAYGNWFSDVDDSGGTQVVVLGAAVSETLFGQGSNPVGRDVRIQGAPFTVVGVTKAKGGIGSDDNNVFIPLNTMRRLLSGGDSVQMISVQTQGQDAMDSVTADIKSLLLQRHGIDDASDADFTVTSQKDLASTVSTITGELTLVLGAIASISLVVGGIGIMNMMLTSVTERIREIGLRKALGANPRDITLQFLAEAITLCLAGGVTGLLLGAGVAAAISALLKIDASVTLNGVLLAVGVSTGIGLAFGYYPARNAARLDPIEALRYQ